MNAAVDEVKWHWTGTLFFSREWAMPSADTFSILPIAKFVSRYLLNCSGVSIDPFARNTQLAQLRNDLNPNTSAPYHMDAADFLQAMRAEYEGKIDLALMDPPYSPRQIADCYHAAGITVDQQATQNAALYARTRDALIPLLSPSAKVLSFGWNSAGMGRTRGFEPIELMIVAHGGGHNDTICMAERFV